MAPSRASFPSPQRLRTRRGLRRSGWGLPADMCLLPLEVGPRESPIWLWRAPASQGTPHRSGVGSGQPPQSLHSQGLNPTQATSSPRVCAEITVLQAQVLRRCYTRGI